MSDDDDKHCEGVLNDSAWVFASTALLLIVLFPVHLYLVIWFIHKLLFKNANGTVDTKSQLKSPMVISMLIYITISTGSLFVGLNYYVIYPMFQIDTLPSLSECGVLIWSSWWFGTMNYLSLSVVFYMRLVLTFEDTAFELDRYFKIIFWAMIIICSLMITIMITVRTSHLSCWSDYSFGFLSDETPMFPRSIRYCSVDERKYGYFSRLVPMISMICFITLSFTVMYIFVKRLDELVKSQGQGSVTHNQHGRSFRALAKKSCVLCLIGLLTTTVSLLMIPISGVPSLVYLDSTLNVCLLSMLFKFGHPMYERSLGNCVRCFSAFCWDSESHRSESEMMGSRLGSMHSTVGSGTMGSVSE